jgi:hypothetical protein
MPIRRDLGGGSSQVDRYSLVWRTTPRLEEYRGTHSQYLSLLSSTVPFMVTRLVLRSRWEETVPPWLLQGAAFLNKNHSARFMFDSIVWDLQTKNQLIPLLKLLDDKAPKKTHIFNAQSMSLVKYLSNTHGPKNVVTFVDTALTSGDWNEGARRRVAELVEDADPNAAVGTNLDLPLKGRPLT